MKIVRVDIQNFRKLKFCQVELAPKQTIFVGANNSGKTSAIDALILFLKKHKNISTIDFTLSNWQSINKIGEDWLVKEPTDVDLSITTWRPFLPAVDIWLQVDKDQVHHITHIIPTLDWTSDTKLGVRLIFEPKDIENFYKGYKAARKAVDSMKRPGLPLWPKTMRDFLDERLHEYFKIQSYIIDPLLDINNIPQCLPAGLEALESDPFEKIFKIDIINA